MSCPGSSSVFGLFTLILLCQKRHNGSASFHLVDHHDDTNPAWQTLQIRYVPLDNNESHLFTAQHKFHFGVKCSMELLQRKFYSPLMCKDIRERAVTFAKHDCTASSIL